MEAVCEDEAKSLASDWIKRLERSILAQVSENHTDETGRHFYGEDSVSFSLGSDASTAESEDIINQETKYKSSDEAVFSTRKENLCRPTTLLASGGIQSNIPPSSNSKSSEKHSTYTNSPRIDLDNLRRKRLEHFQALNHSSLSTKPSNEQEFVSVERPSSPLSLPTRPDQAEGGMLQCEASFSPTLDSTSFDENAWTARSGFEEYRNIGREDDDDDDDLRLELWGLRNAVETGQLDIQSYLGAFPKYQSRQKPDQEIPPSFEKSTPISQSHADVHLSSMPISAVNKNIPKVLPEAENFSARNMEPGKFSDDIFPQRKRRTESSQYSEKLSSLSSQSLQSSIKSNHSLYDDKINHHVNDKNDRLLTNGSSDPNTSFSWPQIQGALYNGFETSDSEGSVRSVHLLQNAKQEKSLVKSPKAEKSSRSGKGKQKILNELTLFIDSERKVKKDRNLPKKSVSPSCSLTDAGIENVNPIENNGYHCSGSMVGESRDQHLRRHPNTETSMPDHAEINRESRIKSPDLFFEQQKFVSPAIANLTQIMAKVCPKCNEINSQAANWCIECGSALIKTKPTTLSHIQQKHYEEQCKEAETLIAEALNGSRKFEVNGVKSNGRNGETLGATSKSLQEDIFGLIKEVNATSTDLKDESYDCNQLSNYKRRWHKSSTAWNTFEQRELSKPSSINISKSKQNQIQADSDIRKSRSSSDLSVKNEKRHGHKSKGSRRRTTSATYHSDDVNIRKSTQKASGKERPHSAVPQLVSNGHKKGHRKRPGSAKARSSNSIGESTSDDKVTSRSSSWTESDNTQLFSTNEPKCLSQRAASVVPPLDLNDINSYDRILTLIRTQRDPIPYLYLPDEILLNIFSSLSHHDLMSCTLVCWQFYRIAMDETLWKAIVLRKKEIKSDDWLIDIGKRRPTSLTISQCRGNLVSAEGLRTMFRSCSDTLEEADFSGCNGGELIGESVLLHISARCTNVVSVDVSWTNVSDNGVQALAENVTRLECLCLNGCQAITDKSLKCVADKHGESLRIFEVFGCFNITPGGIQMLGNQCKHLQTLNLGQCHKMTDSVLGSLVSLLPELENLDLRGCKQARDSAVRKIVHHCPLLTCLVLANCPLITDVSLAEIANNLPGIKTLDICGCSNVSDAGVRALARSCNKMELLDLSSTGNAVTHKSVTSLANYCHQTLHTLKLSFCADITDHTVIHLAKQCKKLSVLHLYGCKRVRNLNGLKGANPTLTVLR